MLKVNKDDMHLSATLKLKYTTVQLVTSFEFFFLMENTSFKSELAFYHAELRFRFLILFPNLMYFLLYAFIDDHITLAEKQST